jgi:hypothetical protein
VEATIALAGWAKREMRKERNRRRRRNRGECGRNNGNGNKGGGRVTTIQSQTLDRH